MRPSKFPGMPTNAAGWASPIVAIIIAIGTVIGNSQHLAPILGSNKEIRDDIESLRKELREFEAIERGARSKSQTRATVTEKRVAYQAGLLCQLNEGKPNETFPCDGFTSSPKPLGQETPKFRSDTKYPEQKDDE